MSASTIKLLSNAYQKALQEPVEGFTVELVDENNLFEWRVWIEGPKDTPYESGIFQLLMKFPQDYPMSPPELRFVSDFWHPNVYSDGKVCISILHPPGEDEMSGERPEERWRPTQTVQTILLSVLSMLNDPNFSSPANVDASVQWRRQKDEFLKKCKQLVEKSLREKPPHVKIPHPDTDPVERAKQVERLKMMNQPMDFYDDDPNDMDEDEDEGAEDEDDEDEEEDEEDEDEEEDEEEDE